MMVCLPLKLAFIAMSLQMTFNIKSEPERHLRSVNIRILRQNYLSLNYFEKKSQLCIERKRILFGLRRNTYCYCKKNNKICLF